MSQNKYLKPDDTGYRVSVIIRTFNRPKLLRRALDSVAAQTWAEREAIVVNDGGEDVGAVVAEYAGRLDIRYLHFGTEEKPGRCLAATRGIEAATGDWIAYLDDDDAFHPDHLTALMEAARVTGAMVLYSDSNHVTERPLGDGSYERIASEPGPSEDFSRAGFYCGTYIHLSTFCHHRKVFDQHGGFDPALPVLEDLDLFFRYAHDHEFHHVKRVTVDFHIRTDGTNAVTAMRKEFQETHEALCQKYFGVAIVDIMSLIQDGRLNLLRMAGEITRLGAQLAQMEGRLTELERRE